MSAAEATHEGYPNNELTFPYSFVVELGPEFRTTLIGMLRGQSQADIAYSQDVPPQDISRSFQYIYAQLGVTDRYDAISALLGANKSLQNFDEVQLNRLDDTERRILISLAETPDVTDVRKTLGLSLQYFYSKSRSAYNKLGVANRDAFWAALHGAPKFIAELTALEKQGVLEPISYAPADEITTDLLRSAGEDQSAHFNLPDAQALYRGLRSFVHNLLIDTREEIGEFELLDPETRFDANLTDDEVEHLIELQIAHASIRETKVIGLATFIAARVLESEDFRYSLYSPFTKNTAAQIILFITHDAKRIEKPLK